MKLFYISPRDVRKNRADCVHIMKSCEEFARKGFKVVLITPYVYRKEYRKKKEEIWALYGIEKDLFKIVELPMILWDSIGINYKFLRVISQFQKFTIYTIYYLLLLLAGKIKSEDIFYSKAYISTIPLVYLKKSGVMKSKIFFEKAEFDNKRKSHKFVIQNIDGVVTINEHIKNRIVRYYQIDTKKILKMNFPSLYEGFKNLINKSSKEIRKSLDLNENDKIVMYAGKIGPLMKEIHYIIQAAKIKQKYKFFFVGIRETYKKYFNEYIKDQKINNVVFIDFQPLEIFAKYIFSADLLVSYYDSFDKLSPNSRVPAKAGLYFLANKPIIMADLPSLREWWGDSQVYYVEPDKPELLAKKIEYIFNNPREAKEKAAKCLEFAKQNTYETSYTRVVNFINSTP